MSELGLADNIEMLGNPLKLVFIFENGFVFAFLEAMAHILLTVIADDSPDNVMEIIAFEGN